MQDVLSPSQLVMFQRCGERWRRRYLEEEVTPPGLSLHVGRAVREAAEACLRHRQASGEVMAEQDALDVAAAAYAASLEEGVHHAPEDEADAAHAEEEGRNTVLTLTSLFVKELAPTLDPVLTAPSVTLDLGLELPVAVTLGCVTADGAARRLSTASRRWSAERAHGAPEAALWPEAVRALTGKAPRLSCSTCSSTRRLRPFRASKRSARPKTSKPSSASFRSCSRPYAQASSRPPRRTPGPARRTGAPTSIPARTCPPAERRCPSPCVTP